MEEIFNGTDHEGIEMKPAKRSRNFSKTPNFVLLALVFLLPIFFVPSSIFPFQFGKTVIFSIATIIIFSMWLLESLSKRRIRVPLGLIFYSSIAVLVFSLLSSLLSETTWRSIIGFGSESETFFFLLMLFLSMFLSYSFIKGEKKILSVYRLLSISALILFIFQALRIIIGPDFLSFGVLTSAASSLLGKWNDIGVFYGLVLILSMMRLMFLKEKGTNRWLSYIMFLFSILGIAIVNSLLIWITVGIFSLMILIYEISFSGEGEVEDFSSLRLPSLVIIVALIFILTRGFVGGFINNDFNINHIEVRPSWGTTLDIAKDNLSKAPLLGTGPNQFSSVWNQSKPNEVNSTPFWNIDFNFSVGFIPTTLITQGILGFISWILLIVGILLFGLKALIAANSVRGIDKFVILSTLFATLYLWTFMVLYLPGVVMIILTFIFTGLFLSVMAYMNLASEKEITFGRDSITGFSSALIISLMLLVNVGLLYSIGVRYISAVYFTRSLVAVNSANDIGRAESYSLRAISLNNSDRNYRLLSNIEILKLNNLLSQNGNLSNDTVRTEFQNLLGSAIQNAQLATLSDQTNYQNWLSLGSIYESIIPLNIEGSYESAVEAYNRARIENPTNPQIDLILARTEVTNNNRVKAREHISNALSKKSNYTEAVFLLSQIEIADGNINEAIRSSESATLISPNDPTLLFQLGFLRYNQNNFRGAVEALERATVLNPNYSNAKYFLGLSYYRLSRAEEAVQQFEDLIELNPDNQEIKIILENIKTGRPALENIETEQPEDRDTLPVEEES